MIILIDDKALSADRAFFMYLKKGSGSGWFKIRDGNSFFAKTIFYLIVGADNDQALFTEVLNQGMI